MLLRRLTDDLRRLRVGLSPLRNIEESLECIISPDAPRHLGGGSSGGAGAGAGGMSSVLFIFIYLWLALLLTSTHYLLGFGSTFLDLCVLFEIIYF